MDCVQPWHDIMSRVIAAKARAGSLRALVRLDVQRVASRMRIVPGRVSLANEPAVRRPSNDGYLEDKHTPIRCKIIRLIS